MQSDPAKEVLEVFKVYDTDQSGNIERGEMKNVLKLLYGAQPPTSDDIDDIMAMVDVNSDGAVNYQEFIQVCPGPGTPGFRSLEPMH